MSLLLVLKALEDVACDYKSDKCKFMCFAHILRCRVWSSLLMQLLPSSTYSRSISRYSLSVAARFRSSLGIIIITYVVRLAPRCTLTAKHFDEDEQDVDGVEEIQFKCSHLTEIGSKLSGHDRRATVANQFLGVS